MTTFGWDMSHYDAPSLGTAVSEGIQFVTHKAGGDANDAELGDWWNGAKGLRSRILLGSYWVLYPGNPSARADMFLARLDAVCKGWRDTDFFLFADCEKWNNDPSTIPSISEVNAFCDRLHARAPKLRPMAYLPQWVYGDKVSACKYPIIESDYVSGSGGFKSLYPGDGSSKWHIGGGKTATILQYTSSAVIGGQTTSDANAFKGDLLALRKLVAPGFYVTEAVKDMQLTDKIGDAANPNRTVGDVLRDVAKWRGVEFGQTKDTENAKLPPNAPLAQVNGLPARVAALEAKLATVDSQAKSNGGGISELKTQLAQVLALLQAKP